MAAPASQAAAQSAAATSLPWWVRYTRWKQTSYAEAVAAEKHLLSLCKTQFDIEDVRVGETQRHTMHTISGGNSKGIPLVCLSGYGAGAGFYFRNFDGMAQHFRVHAVDLLGTGMSGRPPFKVTGIEEAEEFFISSFHKWHESQKLGKVILMGHSLGGYLAAAYALRFPDHVEHLVLVSPAGMARRPDDWQEPEWVRNPWTWRGQVSRMFRSFWELGMTPGTVIRTLGPMGPGLVDRYARNRFKRGMQLSEEEVLAFEDYFYHIMAARGSGEHALRHILAPWAWAKNPMEGRLHELKVNA